MVTQVPLSHYIRTSFAKDRRGGSGAQDQPYSALGCHHTVMTEDDDGVEVEAIPSKQVTKGIHERKAVQ